jgi:hypothetical protein
LFLWEYKRHTGQIGKKNRSIVNGDILLITDDVFDDLSNDIQGEEDLIELYDFVISFEIGCYFFNYLAYIC